MKPLPPSPLRLTFVVALVSIAMGATGPCDSECSTDDDCHGTKICVEGSCVECAEDNDCESNERCDDNECVRDGDDGGEGAGAEGEGVGAEGEGAAEGEGVFGEGEGGAEGEGEGTQSCATSCTCAIGESCINNVCISFPNTCFTDAECPRVDQQCTPQVCDFFAQTCSDAPAGEGEGEGAGEGEGEGEGGDSCTTFLGSGAANDCDCGCGAHDSDCATSTGCDTGGCGTTAQGCDFCWSDVNNQLSACPP